MAERNLPRLVYNFTSATGLVLSTVSLAIIAFFIAYSYFFGLENEYIGILLYMILPFFFLVGLLLIPLGMFRKWRIEKKSGRYDSHKLPYIDFNDKSHRNAAIVFLAGTVFIVLVSSVGVYETYHYSESVEFCGKTCHTVMKPEYTAYLDSPHSRVACTECHVGSGAGWYTKSKLSGAYQVYAVTVNNYPRPIPTPIENLRPAQETCEQCHWPDRFFGAQQKKFEHYMYDDSSTYWPINMLLKVGGGQPGLKTATGIHWHINLDSKVEYIPRDESRQDIPWIKVTDLITGEVTIYQDADDPLDSEAIATSVTRMVDCMDCHNRPSHQFYSPDFAIDQAISAGLISRSLPGIKSLAVELMADDYQTEQEALEAISRGINEYYNDLDSQSDRELVSNAIMAVDDAFSNNIFPEMKARWSEYPVNIGHSRNIGCMRCHDGNHISEQGEAISHNCYDCHTILSQGSGENAEFAQSESGLEFKHPVDIDEMWREVGCYECHTGQQP